MHAHDTECLPRFHKPVLVGTAGMVVRSVPVQYAAMVQCLRLRCTEFWVDVCLLEVNGRWIASADARDGRTLGTGMTSLEALWAALEPFEEVIGELLASIDSTA